MAIELDATAYETARTAMVDCQVRPSDVTNSALIDAMLWAPRELFVPKSRRAMAYVGEHLEMAPGRYELDPRVFAKMVDALAPKSDDLALVIAGGGGYAAAVLSRLCGAVVSVEPDAGMNALAAHAFGDMGVDNVMVEEGALADGRPSHGPYNVILIAGGVERLDADVFAPQLAEGGRLAMIRMSGAIGRCEVHIKAGESLGGRRVFDAVAPVLPGFEAEDEFVF